MPSLIALDGALSGRRFPLDSTFLVGRGPYNHVVIDDARISRQHAKIAPESGGLVVHDLNSANGTFVNDEPVQRRELYPGDVVRFGPFRFRLEGDPDTDISIARVRRPMRPEELTRRGFEAPTKIVGAVDASIAHRPGLADLEDADRKLRTLYTFVQAISATLDTTELLDLVAKNLLDVFPAAAIAAVYMLDKDTHRMEPLRFVQRDGREVPDVMITPLPHELHLQIVQRGQATLSAPMSLSFDDETESQRRGGHSGVMMHAPMLHQKNVHGVLNVRAKAGAAFSEADLDLFTALAAHAALALESAKMHKESLARERLAQDLVLAQQIQKSFLPSVLPRVAGLAFAADYEPAYSVGGDFYDVFWLSPERIGVVVGDVSGKGVSAALLMARVSSDLRAAMLLEQVPARALAVVNQSIVARGQHDIFVTAVCLSIDVRTKVVTVASAGHIPPYVRRQAEGAVIRIDGGASAPLGLAEQMDYEQIDVALAPFDTLVLSTDGVIEATSERGQQFGFEGMEQSLRAGSSAPQELCDRLLAAIRAHVGAAPQYDDLTLVLCGVGA
jgi:serine phosphatase RsbU (regulator of sigma subunit)